jgi:hypothetical protein
MVAWKDMDSAPRDGREIQVEIPGHGSDNVIAWVDGLLATDGSDAGCWAFSRDQEPPDCWTDGYCWEINEDFKQSVQPTKWKELQW